MALCDDMKKFLSVLNLTWVENHDRHQIRYIFTIYEPIHDYISLFFTL